MPEQHPIVGGVLIGGKSKRMGADKATLAWGSSTILETIVQTARAVTTDFVLLGDCPGIPRSLRDMTRVPDPESNAGPMAGLAALLTHFPDQWCLLLSCDIPSVSFQVISTLVDQITPDVKVVAHSRPLARGSMLETCCTLYHASILTNVQRALSERALALQELIRSLPHTTIPTTEETQRALLNINSPEDYSASARRSR